MFDCFLIVCQFEFADSRDVQSYKVLGTRGPLLVYLNQFNSIYTRINPRIYYTSIKHKHHSQAKAYAPDHTGAYFHYGRWQFGQASVSFLNAKPCL